MGRPKLTLPIAGVPLITRLIEALRHGGADPVVVVTPPTSLEGASELATLARQAGAMVLVANAPTPDMRSTVEIGLRWLMSGPAPEALLLAPGDSPGITPALVRTVIEAFRQDPSAIVVPSHRGRRGHPLLLPWTRAIEILALPPDVGVNALLEARASTVRRLEVHDAGTLADLDTPEEYRRWNSNPPNRDDPS